MESLSWYIAGPLLGLSIPLILILVEKQLGVSSSLRVVGSYIFKHVDYFNYDRSSDRWQLYFVAGILLSSIFLDVLILDLELTNTSIYNLHNLPLFLIGGILIGFGARYAGGCTAGHCLMGSSLFSKASLIVSVSFFIGGLLTSHFLIPLIF